MDPITQSEEQVPSQIPTDLTAEQTSITPIKSSLPKNLIFTFIIILIGILAFFLLPQVPQTAPVILPPTPTPTTVPQIPTATNIPQLQTISLSPFTFSLDKSFQAIPQFDSITKELIGYELNGNNTEQISLSIKTTQTILLENKKITISQIPQYIASSYTANPTAANTTISFTQNHYAITKAVGLGVYVIASPENNAYLILRHAESINIPVGPALTILNTLTVNLPSPTPTPLPESIGTPLPEASATPTLSAQGKFCGGFAANLPQNQCPTGFLCKLDGTYPDAAGTCQPID